ncbi:response regulator [Pseudoalteromonas denitrificans]|nr:response regulator [Pseudoalteromonas denitrificans]
MIQRKFNKTKVLIIDDQPLAQSYMKQSLESIGFRDLICAERAQTALRLCQNNKFDLILCSFNLGKDKDGYHLYEELKNKKLVKRTTGFIFISAETSSALVHSVIELQPDDFLAKPFSQKELSIRIEKLLNRKTTLAQIYDFIDVENYSKALKTIQAKLAAAKISHYTPILLRLKGELLLKLSRFAEAKEFFKSVLNIQKFTWAKIGLVESLIANSEFKLAHSLLGSMLERAETRLVAYDLLSKLELQLKNYDNAQDYLVGATQMAPRNINRQHSLVNIARLNHDYEHNYAANRNILKFAKNSIHDNPNIYLNVARAGVDYALTTDHAELVTRLTRQSSECLNELKMQFPDADTQEQLDILHARIHYLKDEREKALALISQLDSFDDQIRSIDDALDKAKALHELGFHYKASILFEKINAHCLKYKLDDSTLIAYVSQERQERDEIKHGPRELNNNAVEQYQKGQFPKAIETFSQAFRVMPKNASIALNLLQSMINAAPGGESLNSALIEKCKKAIEAEKLDTEQQQRFDKLKEQLSSTYKL